MTPTQIYSVIIYLAAIFLSCPMIIDRFVSTHSRFSSFPRKIDVMRCGGLAGRFA
jgi:hypothetical protein